MHINEQLLNTFYTAFQSKDYKTMQQCYADNATFSDAVFVGLNATQVRAMWEMLCVKSKELNIEYKVLNVTETTGSAQWIATYTFSATGNKVINRVTADFTFANGKIVTHKDNFNFYAWAKQALGASGLLLGWTSMLRNKVRAQAAKNLADYMAKK